MRRRKTSPPDRPPPSPAGSPRSAACPTPSRRWIMRGRSNLSSANRSGWDWRMYTPSERSRRVEREKSWPSWLMQQRGAVAFSDDGVGVGDASVMRKALQYAKMLDTVLMQHCEEPTLSGGAMHSGIVSTTLGLPGIPAEAEQLMIDRDLLLNRTIGCRYHVQHISTAGSVELIRRSKKDRLPVTTEVSPHHLLLTDESCRTYDTNFKMNPPLRTAGDVAACIAGVKDGTIDCLATDHAPHLAEEKELEFQYAPNGILGLEPALALYIKALV